MKLTIYLLRGAVTDLAAVISDRHTEGGNYREVDPKEEFGIEPELRWLRSARGRTRAEHVAGKVQGSDSVRVDWDGGIGMLDDCREKLLELYESEEYKSHFGFVDHLRPLPSADRLTLELERKVLQLLGALDHEWLTVAHPDLSSPDVETYRIGSDYRGEIAGTYRDRYGSNFDEGTNVRVVYAIATPKEGALADVLFFFSLVNLVQHKQSLDAMGCPLALAKITREEAA